MRATALKPFRDYWVVIVETWIALSWAYWANASADEVEQVILIMSEPANEIVPVRGSVVVLPELNGAPGNARSTALSISPDDPKYNEQVVS